MSVNEIHLEKKVSSTCKKNASRKVSQTNLISQSELEKYSWTITVKIV